MSLTPDRGIVGSTTTIKVSGIPTKGVHTIVWSTVTGNRVNCTTGTCWVYNPIPLGTVDITDGKIKETYVLDRPDKGLLIPPLTWGTQYNYSSDGSLLVLASEKFDPEDYLHNFEEFLHYRKTNS
jgi:hypothetical protein